MEGIKLVNIDLSGVSKDKQHAKVIEELNELFETIQIGTNEEIISEYFDVIQSWLGYIEKTRGITAEDVMQGYPKHLEKLKFRPRKKECINCELKKNCKLYKSSVWQGEHEAENCRNFINEVR